MKKRGIISAVIGLTQGAIALFTLVLTILIFLGIIEVQTILNLPSELLPFSILILFLFSFFTIISCILLVRELNT